MYPQSLAALKRFLKPRMKLKVTHSHYNSEAVGQIRVIKQMQTNGIWFEPQIEGEQRSWSDLGNAKQVKFHENGYSRVGQHKGEEIVLTTYCYITDEV